jgi:hypothetical protein
MAIPNDKKHNCWRQAGKGLMAGEQRIEAGATHVMLCA